MTATPTRSLARLALLCACACASASASACSQTLEVLSPPPPAAAPSIPSPVHDAGAGPGSSPDPDDFGDVTTDAGPPIATASPCGACDVLQLCAVDTCVDAGGVTAVASWLRHTCKVQDGQLYCWGDNAHGQLGTGDLEPRIVPTRVGSFNDWLHVATSETHTCAIRAPGALYCFGDNASGQLATHDTMPRLQPTAVDTPWPLRELA